jgi:LysM repeat protein
MHKILKIKNFNFAGLFLITVFLSGCAMDGVATKEEISEVQGTLSEEVVSLKKRNDELQGRMDEMNYLIHQMDKRENAQNQTMATKINNLEIRAKEINAKVEELQDEWVKYRAEAHRSFQDYKNESDAKRNDDLSKMDQKMNIVLEEVSKENQRILNEVNTLRQRAPSSSGNAGHAQTGGYHVVQSGESLSKIASLYGISTRALTEANGITNPNSIRVGQKLKIPK